MNISVKVITNNTGRYKQKEIFCCQGRMATSGYLRVSSCSSLCKIKCFSIDALGITKKHLNYFMDMSDCMVAHGFLSYQQERLPHLAFSYWTLGTGTKMEDTTVFSSTVTLEQDVF